MKRIDNIPVWGEPVDPGAIQQINVCSRTAFKTALMADHHLGYAVPIGGVVAYKDKISPSGVGFDIACGNMAVLTDIKYADIKNHIPKLADDIFNQIEFGVGRDNNTKVDHELFDDEAWKIGITKGIKKMAAAQLGTVGSGNHYVDVFVDKQERVWVGVHFGSRGLGHKIATYFLQAGGAKDAIHAEPLVLEIDSDIGCDYLKCMQLAGRYAYAGREWVTHKVVEILGGKVLDTVHNHHNFAWKEIHEGEELWVVRKGATPAFPGQRGFVGGSMGDISVILEGKEHPLAKDAMYSTVHGAGRVMSRNAAKGRFVRDKHGKKQRQGGLVRHDEMMSWVKNYGVCLRGAGVDEAPQCYKRIEHVLEEHKDTIEIKEVLKPIIVCMAGDNVVDPYKD
jgi:tRNA-splicing ligase RtcB (3'-phosphate/5'-hydroxy nucleic acid ligase)